MSVRYYEWGLAKGGRSQSGPTIPPAALYGPVEDQTGTLGVGITTITFTGATKALHILNTHMANDMELSLDGGSEWLNLTSFGDLKVNASVTSILLRGTGGVVGGTFHVIATLI